jgi:hypothetical protein
MKFGCRLIILFEEKSMFEKIGPFSWAMVRPFFSKKRPLRKKKIVAIFSMTQYFTTGNQDGSHGDGFK